MTLYHLSDSLQLGEKLDPDYLREERLCEPFFRAIEYSKDCFFAMLLNGRYLNRVLERYNMVSWTRSAKYATEALFEYIRLTEFPNHPSRILSNYFLDDLRFCQYFYKNTWEKAPEEIRECVHMYEIETDMTAIVRRDMRLYDIGYDAIYNNDDIDAAMDAARRYFAGEQTDDPVWEYLSDRDAFAVVDVTHMLCEQA